MARTKAQAEAHATRLERYPDLKPLDPKDLVANGFELDGSPSIGTTYRDLIALVMREPPDVFEKKMAAIAEGDYTVIRFSKELIVRFAIQRARQGDQKALDWLADREEGKVTQNFSFTPADTTQAHLKELREAVGLGAPRKEGE